MSEYEKKGFLINFVEFWLKLQFFCNDEWLMSQRIITSSLKIVMSLLGNQNYDSGIFDYDRQNKNKY